MANVALRIERLGKRYRIGERRDAYGTLRDRVANVASRSLKAARGIFGRNETRAASEKIREFWALRDVSFDVKHGEVVGVIGRNGAGKSTLLKILSRITEPTEGKVRVFGRVGSLLEVGTGFHPELTGRENVYLNGAILGMPQSEIKRKFDEIVAFAEVEQFLDTPVKRYSSGMQLRLGFAVAAHLDPEILIVDEVLAVGDAAFQKKCIGKLQDAARESRTVLFVSHNIAAIQAICSRGVVLGNGSVVADGPVHESVAEYLRMLESATDQDLSGRLDRSGKGEVRIVKIEIGGINSEVLQCGAPVRFAFYLSAACVRPDCGFTIYDHAGSAVAHLNSSVVGLEDIRDGSFGAVLTCSVNELPLVPGRYRIAAALMVEGDLQDHLAAAAVFDVVEGVFKGRQIVRSGAYGSVCIDHQWLVRNAQREINSSADIVPATVGRP